MVWRSVEIGGDYKEDVARLLDKYRARLPKKLRLEHVGDLHLRLAPGDSKDSLEVLWDNGDTVRG